LEIRGYEVTLKNGFWLVGWGFVGFFILTIIIGKWAGQFFMWCGKFFMKFGKSYGDTMDKQSSKIDKESRKYAKQFKRY